MKSIQKVGPFRDFVKSSNSVATISPNRAPVHKVSSVAWSPGQALGMDGSPLRRRRDDVLQAARSVDDLDGPVDCAQARSVWFKGPCLIDRLKRSDRYLAG